jgi:hypothetical protein
MTFAVESKQSTKAGRKPAPQNSPQPPLQKDALRAVIEDTFQVKILMSSFVCSWSMDRLQNLRRSYLMIEIRSSKQAESKIQQKIAKFAWEKPMLNPDASNSKPMCIETSIYALRLDVLQDISNIVRIKVLWGGWESKP